MKKQEILEFLKNDLIDIIKKAGEITREKCRGKFEVCGIVNAKSGLCSEDCKFCAQSAHYKTTALKFDLKEKSEILAAAYTAKNNRAERFGIVTSGRGLNDTEITKIAEMIAEIKKNGCIDPCASLGELTEEQLILLKNAGLTRYHHNIETSRRFYPSIVSSHTYDDRIAMLKRLKKLGFEICSGGIIGLGETMEDRLDMAYELKKMDVDAVPLNILTPIKGTPLESMQKLDVSEIIKTIAAYRIILEDKIIKIAAGRESALADFQTLAFMAGANGMLIGGYLTIAGRKVEDDWKMLEQLKTIIPN